MLRLRGKTLILTALLRGGLVSPASAKPALEDALINLAPKGAMPPACIQLSRGPKSGFATSLPGLDALVQKIERAIEFEKLADLLTDFHPRLKTTLPQLTEAMSLIKRAIGSPTDAAVFRTWLLLSGDGTPRELRCDDGEFTVTTHYGYNAQIGVWFQVMGGGELGRVFVSLVPKGNRAYIGSWHFHQWSHLGMDSVAWQERARTFLKPEEKPSAYLNQDIAVKLLDQKQFVLPQALKPVRQARDTIMSAEQWASEVESSLDLKRPPSDTSYSTTGIKTALAQDGAGINLYLRSPNEIPSKQVRSDCKILATRIFIAPKFSGVNGVKCMFLLAEEPADREGRMGGQYYSRQEILPKPIKPPSHEVIEPPRSQSSQR